ncbi:hypothetical protein [Sphingosinicella terrae]|uniref:hypothetical protein n=1 Tax=Sphingosinicella terrae TaxID=2172047 RepID=UPI000E0CF2B4|nr:hypothetical protein [Sphingosinicella terrae]
MIALFLAWLLQTVPFQPSPPQPPELVAAQRDVNDTGEAYGRCIMASALDRSGSIADEDGLFEAALSSCTNEEVAAVGAYGDYLRLIGGEASPEQVREIFVAMRPGLRQRVLGCVAMVRTARSEGREPGTC